MRLPALFFLALGISAAQVQPNFSGRWVLDVERSKLEIPKPISTRFAIEHREPGFRLTRTHVYGEKSDTLTIDLTTDGTERPMEAGGARALARLYWEGTSLVAEMKVSRDGEQGTNLVRYSLEDEGRTFVGVERFRSAKLNYDNRWVFGRELRVDEGLRRELLAMRAGDLHPADGSGSAGTHKRNAARLRELIDRHGWPAEDIAGKEGAEAAWMIALHAAGEPEFQKRALQLLRDRAAEGRVPSWQAARLEERMAGPRPRVTGIGGFFFRSAEPAVLRKWYEAQFGILPVPQSYGGSVWRQEAGITVFSPFGKSTTYFGRPEQMWMLNFRVSDLDGMVAQLRKAGIKVDVDPKEYPNGRFARLHDPEGNPIELWQPKPPVQ